MAKLYATGKYGKYGKEIPVSSFSVRPKFRFAEFVKYNGKNYNVWGMKFDGKKWMVKIRPSDKTEYDSPGKWVNQEELSG